VSIVMKSMFTGLSRGIELLTALRILQGGIF
jgi:hypothetical protein